MVLGNLLQFSPAVSHLLGVILQVPSFRGSVVIPSFSSPGPLCCGYCLASSKCSHLHLLFRVSFSTGSQLVLFKSSLMLMKSCQCIQMIIQKQQWTKVWSFCGEAFVVLQVQSTVTKGTICELHLINNDPKITVNTASASILL